MRRGAVVLAVLLSGCVAEGPGPASAPELVLVPAPGGLDVAGSSGREIGFGRAQAGALASVAKVEGAVPVSVPCGGGRQAFRTAAGLRLVFEDARFVGWSDGADAAGRGCA